MPSRRAFDLNLLTVFEAIYETGSITKAARRLGLTQSATSHALARLRSALRDDLFVRSSNSLKPTARAAALFPSFRDSLDGIRNVVSGNADFEPSRTRRAFRIAIPHIAGPFMGLQLEKRVEKDAPAVKLGFDTRTLPLELLLDMEEGRVDLAVDWLRIAEGRFVHQLVFNDRLVLLARQGHPRIGPSSSAAALDAERFVAIYSRTPSWVEPAALRQLISRRRWNVAFHVSELLEVPLVVAGTDLLGAVPLSIAGPLMATNLLQVVPLPASFPSLPIMLSWHAGRRHDPGHMWLRRLVRQEVRRFGERALSILKRRDS